MRIQSNRTRLGLSLVLGVLAGVALLSLPALVPPGQQSSDADTGVSPTLLIASRVMSPLETEIPTTNSTSDKLALAFGLFLILVPGSILSVVAKKWATRKFEDYWYS